MNVWRVILQNDWFLNKFKNQEYNFNKKEIKEKIKKLKYYNILKEKYQNFIYNNKPILFVPFLTNAKEWDLAFLIKNDNEKIDLCLVQISINKQIKKIQQMIMNFDNKKNYIKKKIKMIYGLKVNYVNILFILCKQYQNENVIHFLDKYIIPYIYFNNTENETEKFLYKNFSVINKFKLGIEYHYETNKNIIDNCLKYKYDYYDAEQEDFSIEENEDDENILFEKNNAINDIINNNFQDGKIY